MNKFLSCKFDIVRTPLATSVCVALSSRAAADRNRHFDPRQRTETGASSVEKRRYLPAAEA